MLLDHRRRDVERVVGIPGGRLVGDDLDRLVLVEDLHDAGDLIDAGRGGELALDDLHLAGLAAAGAALLDHVLGDHAADLDPVGADEGVGLVVRRHVDLDDVGALRFGALQFLHQQGDAGILHDQHIRLVVHQRGQGLLHGSRVVVGIAHDVFHAAPIGLHLQHAVPFVLKRHAQGNRQEGDGLVLHAGVVVGAKLARGLGAALLLGHDTERQADQRRADERQGRLRPE